MSTSNMNSSKSNMKSLHYFFLTDKCFTLKLLQNCMLLNITLKPKSYQIPFEQRMRKIIFRLTPQLDLKLEFARSITCAKIFCKETDMSAFMKTMYLYPVSSTTCTTFIRHPLDHKQVRSRKYPFAKWHKVLTTLFDQLLVTLPRKSISKQPESLFHILWTPSKNCLYASLRLEETQNWDVVLLWLLKGSGLPCTSCYGISFTCKEHTKYWSSWLPMSPLNSSSAFDELFTLRRTFTETTLQQYGHDPLPNGQLRTRVEHGPRSQQQLSFYLTFFTIGHHMHPYTTFRPTESTRLEEAAMIHL